MNYYVSKENEKYSVTNVKTDSCLDEFDNYIDASVHAKELESGYSFEKYKSNHESLFNDFNNLTDYPEILEGYTSR